MSTLTMTNHLIRQSLVKAGVALALCLGCGACQTGTVIHVNNRSSIQLENVTLSGNGFEQSIGTIQPNSSVKTQVCPQGESALSVLLEVNSKKLESLQNTYFECGGYVVTVEVDSSLQITTVSTIR